MYPSAQNKKPYKWPTPMLRLQGNIMTKDTLNTGIDRILFLTIAPYDEAIRVVYDPNDNESLNVNTAKTQLLELILEIIGEDEKCDSAALLNGNTQAVAKSYANSTRRELRQAFRKAFGGNDE